MHRWFFGPMMAEAPMTSPLVFYRTRRWHLVSIKDKGSNFPYFSNVHTVHGAVHP